jgi:hypothetical protein
MKAQVSRLVIGLVVLAAWSWLAPRARSQEFVRTVIDPNFPGAYQVEAADVNGDRKPDVIAVGGGTCAWYENPTWKKRVVSGPEQTPGIISSATADLDGDGKAEIAIAYEFAMKSPTKGQLTMAVQAGGIDDPWRLVPIAAVGSIHRLRWGDLDGDKRLDLVVAPIFGPDARPPAYADPAQLGVFRGLDWRGGSPPKIEGIAHLPVMHAVDVVDLFRNGRSWILTASDLGTARIGLANQAGSGGVTHWQYAPLTYSDPDAPAAKRGASEVHAGRMADGRYLLATLEPWHGNRVVVYTADTGKGLTSSSRPDPHSPRTVLDDTLSDGHALWLADVDRDGDDEVFAGHRGKDHRVSMYDFDRGTKQWKRTIIDRDIAAQDLRGGDLDGDGTPDVVAVGGSTHNVVWYRLKP